MTPEMQRLYDGGNWMVRMDNDGVSPSEEAGGFRWAPLGEWTEAPDWDPSPRCGEGLHGQSPRGHGCCIAGSRLVLCETEGEQIPIDGDKVKVLRARIMAVNEGIPPEFLAGVSLNLEGYTHPLPAGLASVGGNLYLRGYTHPLPAGLASVGGSLDLEGYGHPLPAGLASVGGNLDLRGYTHPLPAVLASVGGNLDLEGYGHPLPSGLASVGGYLDLGGYTHPLPAGLRNRDTR